MMKVVTIVGARPQFVKAAVVSRALGRRPDTLEILVHTGQHYDPQMTDVFFAEMGIPAPAHHLGVGSVSHGAQTGRMLEGIERIIIAERPDWVLVYGDTNSTLAGALAAAKLHIPLVHVEAGLRSHNRRMPEEINRILTDQVSDLLFAPSAQAVANLRQEGVNVDRIELVGDVMYDAALFYSAILDREEEMAPEGEYALATVHRAENTDDPARLAAIFEALSDIAKRMSVVLPLHPRTKKKLDAIGGVERYAGTIRFMEPQGYLGMIALERGARIVLTDSGGVQKEAFFFRRPCVTLREETEWTELVTAGWNRLAPPSDPESMASAIEAALATDPQALVGQTDENMYGNGAAGEKIVDALLRRRQ